MASRRFVLAILLLSAVLSLAYAATSTTSTSVPTVTSTQVAAFNLPLTEVSAVCWYPLSVSAGGPCQAPRKLINVGQLWSSTSHPLLPYSALRSTGAHSSMADSWRPRSGSDVFGFGCNPRLLIGLAWAFKRRNGFLGRVSDLEHFLHTHGSLNQLVEYTAHTGCEKR